MSAKMRISRREFLQLASVTSGAAFLAACAPLPATVAPKAKEPTATTSAVTKGEPVSVGGSATGVPYQKKDSINNGEPIKLAQWDWHPPRQPWYQKKAGEYQKMYPNVSIDLVLIPVGVHGTDYQTKMTAAVPVGEGPDILQIGVNNTLINDGWAVPLAEEAFDRKYLEENWDGYSEGHFYDKDKRYYQVPWGSMGAMIYVNKKLWDEAGLTEKDYPKTWDDMLVLAKKLTKYDNSGNIDVAGFAFNGWFFGLLWSDMNYQQGRYQFTQDGKACQVNTPEGTKSLETLLKFYDQKINAPNFLNADEAFQTGKAAMIWCWTFYTGVLQSAFPDLEFFTINMPSFTGTNLPSLGRKNYENSPVVNHFRPEANRTAAMDYMHWLHSNDDNLIDLAFLHGIAPTYKKLSSNPRVVNDPTISELSKVIEYKVFPGDFSNPTAGALIQGIGQNIIAGASADKALKDTQESCTQAQQEQNYWIIERLYSHADKMIPNQP